MVKPSKRKKDKVPKISEKEYAAYVLSLRGGEESSRSARKQTEKTTDLR